MKNKTKESQNENIKRYTLNLPKELHKKIKIISSFNDNSMQDLMLNVLKKNIKERVNDNKKLLKLLNK